MLNNMSIKIPVRFCLWNRWFIYYTVLLLSFFFVKFSLAQTGVSVVKSSSVKKVSKSSVRSPATVTTLPMSRIKAWKAVRQMNGVSTYVLLNNRSTVGVFHTKALEKPLSWKEVRSKKFFEQFKENKRRFLSVMKISNWEVSSQRWKRRKGYLEWNLEGSYNNSSGKKVYFKENHLYFPSKLHQVLITSNEQRFFETTKDEDFIKVAQRELIRIASRKDEGKHFIKTVQTVKKVKN